MTLTAEMRIFLCQARATPVKLRLFILAFMARFSTSPEDTGKLIAQHVLEET